MNKRNVYIVAGPNGSGKTTFAVQFLPKYAHCKHFNNAGVIPVLIAEGKNGKVKIINRRLYDKIIQGIANI